MGGGGGEDGAKGLDGGEELACSNGRNADVMLLPPLPLLPAADVV